MPTRSPPRECHAVARRDERKPLLPCCSRLAGRGQTARAGGRTFTDRGSGGGADPRVGGRAADASRHPSRARAYGCLSGPHSRRLGAGVLLGPSLGRWTWPGGWSQVGSLLDDEAVGLAGWVGGFVLPPPAIPNAMIISCCDQWAGIGIAETGPPFPRCAGLGCLCGHPDSSRRGTDPGGAVAGRARPPRGTAQPVRR